MKEIKFIYHAFTSIILIFTVACTQQPSGMSGTSQPNSTPLEMATENSLESTSTLVPTVTRTPPLITSTPETVRASLATSVSTPTLAPIDKLDIVDSLILYMTAAPFADEDFWALRAWPNNLTFDQSIFETFYGKVAKGVDSIDQSLYFFNFRPQVSPNGRYILLPGIGGYSSPDHDLGTGLWIVDLQTESTHQILPQAKITTWNPQGDQLTYIEGDTLYTLAIKEGAVPVPLFTHPDLNWLYARWSPDGQWIATMTSKLGEPDETGGPEITDTYWIIPTNGGPIRELATRNSFAIEYTSEEMTWSPDSQFLLVRNELFDLDGKQILPKYPGKVHWLHSQPQLLLINSDDGLRLTTIEGREIATIGNSFSPAWNLSRNGQKLAYSQTTNNAQANVFIFDLTTQENQFIGSVPAAHLAILRWSGDDNHLIMGDRQDVAPIWAMNAQPNSIVEVILDKGVLIEVVATSGQ